MLVGLRSGAYEGRMPRAPDLRRRLQDIALELYGEHGFESVTTAQIAARAGVTERTFFRYFADKREVLFDEDARLRPALIAAIAEAPEGQRPLAMVLNALRSAQPLFEENRPFTEPRLRIIAATPALQERAEAKTAALNVLLAKALERRGVDPNLALLAARTGMAAFSHALQAWFRNPSRGLADHLAASSDALRNLIALG
jgi:AcrR family transcriptional regulator